jgi:hypothetical protein
MTYYLSYLEKNGRHAALMISKQEEASQPTKIICEIGFSARPPFKKLYFFKSQRGSVHEENNASRVLYSQKADIKHRTFVISESELAVLMTQINHDRRTQIDGETKNKYIPPGGPDYHLIYHNCKTYVLTLLKKIQLVDAEQLDNFFIRAPNTSNCLLKKITKNALFCPRKDELINKVATLVTQIHQDIGPNIAQEALRGLRFHATKLNRQVHKVGINSHFMELIPPLIAALDTASNPTHAEQIHAFKQALTEISTLAHEIYNLERLKSLDIYWRSAPKVTPRLSFANFTHEEKLRMSVQLKSNDMLHGFTELLTEINQQLNTKSAITAEKSSDLHQLNQLILRAKKKLETSDQQFFKSIHDDKTLNIIDHCMNQRHQLNHMLDELHQKVSAFVPASKETPLLIRFMARVLKYLKLDFIFSEKTDKYTVRDTLFSIQKSAKKLDARLHLTNPDLPKPTPDNYTGLSPSMN